jgi:dTDP-4-amino-4,6-dideoxygalactose transaminase
MEDVLAKKRAVASFYREFFSSTDLMFHEQVEGSNYWLNAVSIPSPSLETLNYTLSTLQSFGVSARPIWELMPSLPHLRDLEAGQLTTALSARNSFICLPSSPKLAG